ncbi:class I SAM-dependent methyltransferase [Bacillus alkalicellulosilyticus]|uniref:class I SAM-dependent methyltransferase n=1 Tax=Alkalihalobacterium alkalicellulosilyticum TaxID=1912214 RepID=UPI000997845D|nr:class I SAM-dependent methyltransferase [Bacillus alkalicellulosilyticus]
MSDHYYSENPSVESKPKQITFELRGKQLSFVSDSGVFSKKEIDFGTQLLLESFEFPTSGEGALIDVGCGYGPIGITLAKEDKSRKVYMVDINERALELSRKNAEKNGAANVVVRKSRLFDNVNTQKFSAVITNPPIRAGKQVVHELFEQAFEQLETNGELWVVIQKKQGAPSAIEKIKSLFQECEVVSKKKGYYIIRAKKI